MNRYKYKYTDEHLKYMFEQQHEVQAANSLKMYEDLSIHEFSQFENYIGKPKVVFEAGCGVGRGAVFLNHLLQDKSVEYILADRTGWKWTNKGNLHEENDDIYNDLEITADFCKLNGLAKFKTFDTELDDWSTLPKADLIFSLCAFGMHISIEKYIDQLISIANPNSTMIFGTRTYGDRRYSASSFTDKFEQVIYIPGNPSPKDQTIKFPEEDWLILKGPK